MTITRTITVAAGVFAPGHLGELTWQVPFELADSVLQEAGAREQRLRDLPSRTGLYFVLALGLFPRLGYQRVWQKLTAALDGQPGVPAPTVKALRDLRRRIGAAPLKALFEVLAGPAAQPSTPGVRFGRYRTVAFDGCTSIKVPDTSRNRAWLGKMKAALGVTGYPAIELMTLVETGTRALIGAVFGPPATGEADYALSLAHLLTRDMLVLTDRGFDAAPFLQAVAAAPAQFLARLRGNRRLAAAARLDDGTFLSVIGAVKVRVIDAEIIVTCADGTRYCGRYKLATTLTDHRRYPAAALIRLYHERREHEVAYLALRHTLLDGRVLRSRDPAGLEQEIWGTAGPVPGATPGDGHRRRDRARHRPRPGQLHHRAGDREGNPHRRQRRHHRQHQPHRPDRPRRPRRAAPAPPAPGQRPQSQVPLSRWNKADPHRPARSTPVTAMTLTLSEPATARQPATRPAQRLTATPGP